jgi:hypothetical protein
MHLLFMSFSISPMHAAGTSGKKIKIESVEELFGAQKEILRRVRLFPNGEALFLINPFMLLHDVGVELSGAAQDELKKKIPLLKTCSPATYSALKNASDTRQFIQYRIKSIHKEKQN